MKATEAKLLEFLCKSRQFIIPIYQRTYSWEEPECRQLWEDILRSGENEDIAAHFVGSIVYIEKGLYQVTNQPPLLVIDGQQRLTTIMLLLEALARQLGDAEPVNGFSARKLRKRYLCDPDKDGEAAHKLLLTQTDKETLLAITGQKSMPAEQSLRLTENFAFFEEKVKTQGDNLEALCKGLDKLIVVDIALIRDQDNPQLIFESLNSTGRELSQADLIRNFILMGLDPRCQEQLYNDYWRRMETAFEQEAYSKHFDGFMRHYLTLKTGKIPQGRKVYEAFKVYARSPQVHDIGTIVAGVQTFADYYCAMALGKEKDPVLAVVFADLRELNVDVAYPFLLELYNDYTKGLLSVEELEKAVRLVESYVFRRAVCGIPTNSLNKTFLTFGQALKKDCYLESIQAQFLLQPSYRRFPGDEEFRRELMVRDLYNFRRRNYWLRRLENHDRKERVHIKEYTIEHIMPQNDKLSQEWRDSLGEDWKQVHEKWLHTLGNLTLTGYNSEYSDRPFKDKRDMKGGFRDSPIKLNEGLGQTETWNESAIKKRADRLASQASIVWAAPSLNDGILDRYRTKVEKQDAYTIDDHKFLEVGTPVRSLFDDFRKSVLTLDPYVTEEFLKLYVAYKAKTNFVDVVPQAKRLRLSLNLQFHELHDPHKFAKDVTNLGRWGNGDVEVGLSKQEELPYVMALVRQAYEKQMDDGVGRE